MPWLVKVSADARKQVEQLPVDRLEPILRSLRAMEQDPFLGDVQPLKGRKWKGFYRKRAGRYRIIFFPNHQDRIIEVSAIVPRTEKTYR